MPREAPVTSAIREAEEEDILRAFVMPRFVPSSHVFAAGFTDADGRNKPAYDQIDTVIPRLHRISMWGT